jgi:hypothetical protein
VLLPGIPHIKPHPDDNHVMAISLDNIPLTRIRQCALERFAFLVPAIASFFIAWNRVIHRIIWELAPDMESYIQLIE